MTLTFNLATWFLFATHRLIVIIICAKLFSNPTTHNKVMGRNRTSFTGLCSKFKVRTVTLTSDLAAWFLFATHYLIMIIICAKLFSNSAMYNKFMRRTRIGFIETYAQSLSADFDLDL